MPIITVQMFAGRTRGQKRAMAKSLTEAFVDACGGTPQSVQIVIQDVDKTDWAMSGVIAADRDA